MDPTSIGEIAAEVERCREDFVYFLENYCYISNPQKFTTMPFVLWDFQHEVVEAIQSNRFLIILKARQLGISWIVCGYALWVGIFKNNSNILLLSHKEELAKGLLSKIRFMSDRLPPWMMPKIRNSNLRLLEFGNDSKDVELRFESKIQALPATEEAGRSETATLVICDEWAFHPYAETNFTALEPTFGAGGQFIGVSTANGLGNFYHKTWIGSTSAKNDFSNLFLAYDKHPERREPGWYEERKKKFLGDPREFEQEYPRNPMEAFIATGGCIFDLDGLQYLAEQVTRDPLATHEVAPRNETIAQMMEKYPYSFDVWNTPRFGQRFAIGADPAGGGADGDYATAYVIDAVTKEMYASVHARLEPDEFAGVLAQLAGLYNNATIIPERNNHGYALIAMLQNVYGYGNIYKYEDKQFGWPTNVKTKELMNGILQREIKERTLSCYDMDFVNEAQAYVRNGTKTGATEGMHDDRVIALGVALAALEKQPVTVGIARSRVTPKKHFRTRQLRR